MDKYIMKKDNVYVVVKCEIDAKEEIPGIQIVLQEKSFARYSSANLYGGRVEINAGQTKKTINIDGIQLKKIATNSDYSYHVSEKFSLEEITAYLNQIENLGVDSFLENYKETIKNTRKELDEFVIQLEQDLAIKENSEKRYILDSIREIQAFIIAILFALCINMNAGLDNHAYTDAYEYIVNTYL